MEKLAELGRKLFYLLRRRELEHELEEEFRFHLEMKIRENIDAGMSEEEARWAARRAFGNRDLAKRDSRDTWRFALLGDLSQDVRHALRTLVRNPVFATAVVLTLALGIGANTAIFSLIDSVLLRSLPVESPQELYSYGSSLMSGTMISDGVYERSAVLFSHPMYQDFREHTRAFSGLTAISSFTTTAYVSPDPTFAGTHTVQATAELVSGNFFSLLGVRPMLGRLFTGQDDRAPGQHPVAVISYGFWSRRFGQDPSAVGRTLNTNGTELTIIGVTPPRSSSAPRLAVPRTSGHLSQCSPR